MDQNLELDRVSRCWGEASRHIVVRRAPFQGGYSRTVPAVQRFAELIAETVPPNDVPVHCGRKTSSSTQCEHLVHNQGVAGDILKDSVRCVHARQICATGLCRKCGIDVD